MTDLVITASQVLPGSAAGDTFEHGTAGVTITAGQPVYLDSVTSTFKLADCNDTVATAVVKGIALHGALAGQPLKVQTGGTLTLGAGAAPVLATIYVLGAAAGGIAPAADLATGHRTSILGVAGASNTLTMKLFASGQVKA